MHSTIKIALALGICFFLAAEKANAKVGHRVTSIYFDGRSVRSSMVWLGDDRRATSVFANVTIIPDNERVEVPPQTGLELHATDGNDTIELGAGAVVTLESSVTTRTVTQGGGLARFSIIPNSLNFFHVIFQRFTAAANGTVFSVDARAARHVVFTCTRGTISVTRTESIAIADQNRVVRGINVITQVSAHGVSRASYPVNPAQYFLTFGSFQFAVAYFQHQLDVARASGDPQQVDAALESLTMLYDETGQYPEALQLGTEWLRFALLHEGKASPASVADANSEISFLYGRLQRPDLALVNAWKGVNLWRRLDPAANEIGYANAYNSLGAAFDDAGEIAQAEVAYRTGIAAARRAGSPVRVATLEENIGVIDGELQDYDGELFEYNMALKALRAAYPSGRSPSLAWLYDNLSGAYANVEQWRQAIRYARIAVAMSAAIIGNSRNEIVTGAEEDLAYDLEQYGELDEALSVTNGAIKNLTIAGMLNSKVGSSLLTRLGWILADLDQPDKAKSAFARAYAVDRNVFRFDNSHGVGAGLNDLEHAAAAAGDELKALQYATAELALAQTTTIGSVFVKARLEGTVAARESVVHDDHDALIAESNAINYLRGSLPFSRRRLVAAYLDRADEEESLTQLEAAMNDAQIAENIAGAYPTLTRQAADALRMEARLLSVGEKFQESASDYDQVVVFDRRSRWPDPIQLAHDDVSLAIALHTAKSDPQREASALDAAVTALRDVPSTAAGFAWLADQIGDEYSTRGNTAQSLKYHSEALQSLEKRRPLMNDKMLAFFATDVGIDYQDKDDYSNARAAYLVAVRVRDNPQTHSNPEDVADANALLAFSDVPLKNLSEMGAAARTGLDALVATANAGFARLACVCIVAHDYAMFEVAGPAADPSILPRIRSGAANAVTYANAHDLESAALLEFVIAEADSQLGRSEDAIQENDAAKPFVQSMSAHDRSALSDSIWWYLSWGGVEKNYLLEHDWASARTIVDQQIALTSKDSSDRPNDRLVSDYEALSDTDIYIRRPRDAVRDAELGLTIDPRNGVLLLNLAHGYLYSGDLATARGIYLAHFNDKVADGTLASAALRDFHDYRAAGVDVPGTRIIEAELQSAMIGSPKEPK